MGTTEVLCFVSRCEDQENVAELLVREARSRWQDLNLCKRVSVVNSDFPGAKSGIDDISAVVAY
jgi:hypothetical protein